MRVSLSGILQVLLYSLLSPEKLDIDIAGDCHKSPSVAQALRVVTAGIFIQVFSLNPTNQHCIHSEWC
jgi:hypothetical protein